MLIALIPLQVSSPPPFPNPFSSLSDINSPIVTFDWPQSQFISNYRLPLDNSASGDRSSLATQPVGLTRIVPPSDLNSREYMFLYLAGGECLFNNSIGVRVSITFASGSPLTVVYDMILIPNAKGMNQTNRI